jgi:hypothetical protein
VSDRWLPADLSGKRAATPKSLIDTASAVPPMATKDRAGVPWLQGVTTGWEAEMETTSAVIGIAEGMHAARVETRRIIEAHKGDLVAEYKDIQARLVAAGLISDDEAKTLLQLYRIGFEAGEKKRDPRKAFFEPRDIYNKMAARVPANPVALVIASAAVGSYELSEGDDGSVVVTVFKQSYGQAGASIGAGIGVILGGVAGGILGGQIGGFIGGIIDDKGKGKGK